LQERNGRDAAVAAVLLWPLRLLVALLVVALRMLLLAIACVLRWPVTIALVPTLLVMPRALLFRLA
jgi:hypothetical protein